MIFVVGPERSKNKSDIFMMRFSLLSTEACIEEVKTDNTEVGMSEVEVFHGKACVGLPSDPITGVQVKDGKYYASKFALIDWVRSQLKKSVFDTVGNTSAKAIIDCC
jgi:hypothetical protein